MQNFDGRHQDITVVRPQSDFKKTGTRLSTKFEEEDDDEEEEAEKEKKKKKE